MFQLTGRDFAGDRPVVPRSGGVPGRRYRLLRGEPSGSRQHPPRRWPTGARPCRAGPSGDTRTIGRCGPARSDRRRLQGFQSCCWAMFGTDPPPATAWTGGAVDRQSIFIYWPSGLGTAACGHRKPSGGRRLPGKWRTGRPAALRLFLQLAGRRWSVSPAGPFRPVHHPSCSAPTPALRQPRLLVALIRLRYPPGRRFGWRSQGLACGLPSLPATPFSLFGCGRPQIQRRHGGTPFRTTRQAFGRRALALGQRSPAARPALFAAPVHGDLTLAIAGSGTGRTGT